MFNFFNKTDIKPLKVCRNQDRSKKYGIGAESLRYLVKKIEEKFKIKNFELFYNDCLLFDENFFKTVPNQSLVVIVEQGDTYKTETEVIIGTFQKIYHDTLMSRDLIQKFLVNNQNQDLIKAVLACQKDMDEKTKMSSRDSHAEWFSNIESRKATKEEIMRSKARDRIKGYFYKTKDELTKSRIYQVNAAARKLVDDLLNDFFILLSGADFFECLFDRSHEKKQLAPKISDEIDAKAFVKRRKVDEDTKLKIKGSRIFEKYLVSLCNDLGIFYCHGTWKAESCSYEHKINPYASRESFILFQIFNLDHQVEISRSIFPSIVKNIEKLCLEKNLKCEEHGKEATNISTITYFLEIFTVKNLKLVHIICHDKGSHLLDTNGRLLCEDCSELKLIKRLKARIA